MESTGADGMPHGPWKGRVLRASSSGEHGLAERSCHAIVDESPFFDRYWRNGPMVSRWCCAAVTLPGGVFLDSSVPADRRRVRARREAASLARAFIEVHSDNTAG
jgi:hypothetical protein